MEQYNVTGMSCAACSARVEKAVSKVPGVTLLLREPSHQFHGCGGYGGRFGNHRGGGGGRIRRIGKRRKDGKQGSLPGGGGRYAEG